MLRVSPRYMPILPMVLVNGAEGIGTGWSTYIPNYSPREIVANIKRLLAGEQQVAMIPWYRGFKGSIVEVENRKGAKSYICSGTVNQVRVLRRAVQHAALEQTLRLVCNPAVFRIQAR